MCLGVPMEVIEAEGWRALCRGDNGTIEWIDCALVGPQRVGTWLLVHLGVAREVLEPERAALVRQALAALSAAQAGASIDVAAFFPDLNREPQLPEFLRETRS
ncbi:HypC/HybG/HupF family hydrogenase formation chaperone [Hydrogenophilus islandicus]|jgi:hydrogenase expression/formation protein HypC